MDKSINDQKYMYHRTESLDLISEVDMYIIFYHFYTVYWFAKLDISYFSNGNLNAF